MELQFQSISLFNIMQLMMWKKKRKIKIPALHYFLLLIGCKLLLVLFSY